MIGAQTDITNNDSKTAFDLAKDPETAALLQHAGELRAVAVISSSPSSSSSSSFICQTVTMSNTENDSRAGQ